VAEVFGDRAGRGADGGSDRPTVRLPPRRSSFVGRAAELGEIAARLGRYAVVTLVGGGDGLGHGAPLLAPGEVNPVLAKFLD
jgi:hypothetical protein